MSKIKILQAKLVKGKKDKHSLIIAFTTKLGEADVHSENEYAMNPHEDLKKAFAGLNIHLGLISEMITEPVIPIAEKAKLELAKDFRVTSFAYGGKEESPVITITGMKKLSSGKEMLINAPFIGLDEETESPYTHLDHLKKKLTILEDELMLYMNGDKIAPDPQLPLFDENKPVFEATPESVVYQIVEEANA